MESEIRATNSARNSFIKNPNNDDLRFLCGAFRLPSILIMCYAIDVSFFIVNFILICVQPPEVAGKIFWFMLFFIYSLPRLITCILYLWETANDKKLNWSFLTRYVTLVLYLLISISTVIFVLALPEGQRDNVRHWRSTVFFAYCIPFGLLFALEVYIWNVFKQLRNLRLKQNLASVSTV